MKHLFNLFYLFAVLLLMTGCPVLESGVYDFSLTLPSEEVVSEQLPYELDLGTFGYGADINVSGLVITNTSGKKVTLFDLSILGDSNAFGFMSPDVDYPVCYSDINHLLKPNQQFEFGLLVPSYGDFGEHSAVLYLSQGGGSGNGIVELLKIKFRIEGISETFNHIEMAVGEVYQNYDLVNSTSIFNVLGFPALSWYHYSDKGYMEITAQASGLGWFAADDSNEDLNPYFFSIVEELELQLNRFTIINPYSTNRLFFKAEKGKVYKLKARGDNSYWGNRVDYFELYDSSGRKIAGNLNVTEQGVSLLIEVIETSDVEVIWVDNDDVGSLPVELTLIPQQDGSEALLAFKESTYNVISGETLPIGQWFVDPILSDSCSYHVDNRELLDIDEDGKIYALKPGTTVLVAALSAKPLVRTSITIQVLPRPLDTFKVDSFLTFARDIWYGCEAVEGAVYSLEIEIDDRFTVLIKDSSMAPLGCFNVYPGCFSYDYRAESSETIYFALKAPSSIKKIPFTVSGLCPEIPDSFTIENSSPLLLSIGTPQFLPSSLTDAQMKGLVMVPDPLVYLGVDGMLHGLQDGVTTLIFHPVNNLALTDTLDVVISTPVFTTDIPTLLLIPDNQFSAEIVLTLPVSAGGKNLITSSGNPYYFCNALFDSVGSLLGDSQSVYQVYSEESALKLLVTLKRGITHVENGIRYIPASEQSYIVNLYQPLTAFSIEEGNSISHKCGTIFDLAIIPDTDGYMDSDFSFDIDNSYFTHSGSQFTLSSRPGSYDVTILYKRDHNIKQIVSITNTDSSILMDSQHTWYNGEVTSNSLPVFKLDVVSGNTYLITWAELGVAESDTVNIQVIARYLDSWISVKDSWVDDSSDGIFFTAGSSSTVMIELKVTNDKIGLVKLRYAEL